MTALALFATLSTAFIGLVLVDSALRFWSGWGRLG